MPRRYSLAHKPTGDTAICAKCGYPAYKHNPRAYKSRQIPIIGIDGEGQGRAPHRYTFLAAVNEAGKRFSVSNNQGLSTIQCLDFLLSLPQDNLVLGYSLGYDWTKILMDMDNETLYSLIHEETRMFIRNGRVLYHPVNWAGYQLNYINGKMSLRHVKRRTAIWDIWRFFQGKFTAALKDWEVATKEEIAEIEKMKLQRGEFDKLDGKQVEEYCFDECLKLTRLARKLITAHRDAGLELASYYGAGSTASVFLKRIDVKQYRGVIPEDMRRPIAQAFFGGRFENSVIGSIRETTYNYDIASAYPYQTTFLPCLSCGDWKHDKSTDISSHRSCTLSLCHWRIDKPVTKAWGLLPMRSELGSIAFPLRGEGWCWKQEFVAAYKLNPNAKLLETWCYNRKCDHQPFESVPQYYIERAKLGEDAKGIVIKLGLNSIYGKLAQSKGVNPPFQSWIWAGNITSGTRAQLLDSLKGVDPWSILMMATDGIWSTLRLKLPRPLRTGTEMLPKPLGVWVKKEFPQGVFAVRPGIYFPLNPSEEQMKEVRARGLGKRVLYEQWPLIVDAYNRGLESVEVGRMSRFIGMKTALSKSEAGINRSPDYGEWIPHSIRVQFNPAPKRERVLKDCRLACWEKFDWESEPYDAALKTPEAEMIRLAELIAEEQPDADFSDLQ